MKKIFILLVLFSLMICSLYAEKSDSLSLEGSWSYSFSSDNKSCTIRGDRIVNRSDSPNFFKVAFLLFEKECSGFPAFAYTVGEKSYSTLKSGYQYEKTNFTLTDFKKSQPKTGIYYPVIALLAYKNGEYGVVDYLTFSSTIYFKNTFEDEADSLMSDLAIAEEQIRYWQMQMFSSYDGGVAARQLAQQYINEKNTIIEKLNALNYNYYSRTQSYAKTSYHKSYSSIPEKVPTTASAPTYVPDYSNSYSSPSSSSSSSSGSSSSSSSGGMHKVRETCTSCNGTGKDLYKTWNAPNYDGIELEKWCDICKKVKRLHTHDYCHLCNGTGIWEHWTY